MIVEVSEKFVRLKMARRMEHRAFIVNTCRRRKP